MYSLVSFGKGGFRVNGTHELVDNIENGECKSLKDAKKFARELAIMFASDSNCEEPVKLGIIKLGGEYPTLILSCECNGGKRVRWM